jgi:hypothetical protein
MDNCICHFHIGPYLILLLFLTILVAGEFVLPDGRLKLFEHRLNSLLPFIERLKLVSHPHPH